jgi:hypothetical protein
MRRLNPGSSQPGDRAARGRHRRKPSNDIVHTSPHNLLAYPP